MKHNSAISALVKQKINRNDPCPCGSGKKYKQCCLLKEQQAGKSAKYSHDGKLKFTATVVKPKTDSPTSVFQNFSSQMQHQIEVVQQPSTRSISKTKEKKIVVTSQSGSDTSGTGLLKHKIQKIGDLKQEETLEFVPTDVDFRQPDTAYNAENTEKKADKDIPS